MSKKIEAIALLTMNEEGRHIGKALIRTTSDKQAIELLQAIGMVQDVRATPARREFDVFGKMVWLEAHA